MAGFFVAASSQYLIDSTPPTLSYPFTVGLWVRLTSVGINHAVFTYNNPGSTERWSLTVNNTNQFSMSAVAAGSVSSATVATAAAGVWYFWLARYISATSRLEDILDDKGAILHASNATSRSPAVDSPAITLGSNGGSVPSTFLNGSIAEFWYTLTDVQPDGAQTADPLLRQLALGGPFSVPHVASSIIDYRSLRYALGSDQDSEPDYYGNYRLRQTWANINGATLGVHPNLAQFRGPSDIRRLGVV